MKFIRRLLFGLGLAIALAALIIGAAFLPPVQTWAANWALTEHLGLHASVGAVSVGFSTIEATDLRIELEGGVLTVPTLEAGLALKTALFDRKFLFGRLFAKGWTLDLSHGANPGGQSGSESSTPTKVPAAEASARALAGLLRFRALPYEVALDGVDLAGDVLVAIPAEKEPAQIHVLLKGGGLSSGHAGTFTLEALGTGTKSLLPIRSVGIQGKLILGLSSARTFDRIEFSGALSAKGAALPEDLVLTAAATTNDGVAAENYTLALNRGERALVRLDAALAVVPAAKLAGTWKLDMRDSDLGQLASDRLLTFTAATGEGLFETDTAFDQVKMEGRINATGSRWGRIASNLERFGEMTLAADFDLTHRAPTLQFNRLSLSVAGARPIALARATQVFTLDEKTGEIKPTDSGVDWLKGSLEGLPLAWLPTRAGGISLGGGDASGEFVVTKTSAGIRLRGTAPIVARGVALQRAGRPLAEGLDLSLSLLADFTAPPGWQVQAAPLSVDRAGRHLATIAATISPTTRTDGAIQVAGTWTADLATGETTPANAAGGSPPIPQATGEFSALVGTSADVQGKITLTGQAPVHTLATSGHAFFDASGRVTFQGLTRVTVGTNESEFSTDGTWTPGKQEQRIDLDLTAVKVPLEHLSLFATHLPAPRQATWPALLAAAADGPPRTSNPRDREPFWSDLIGRVRFNFYELLAGNQDWNEVAGTLDFDPKSIRLDGGRGILASPRPEKEVTSRPKPANYSRPVAKSETPRSAVTAEGRISFDPNAERPYQLNATGTLGAIDAARLLDTPPAAKNPLWEGRCAVTSTFTGTGLTLDDLLRNRLEEFKLTSKGGILRLLNTTAAQSISEVPTPVKDALAPIGSAVGFLLGIKEGAPKAGKSPYSKSAEAVIEFTHQIAEIRYDQLAVTATRGADRAIRLSEIAISAPNETLTGSGQIEYVTGKSIRTQPIGLDLHLAFRGPPAGYLTTAGVLSSEKDTQGYTPLPTVIHWGGTLDQIDESQWRDLLVNAAVPPPPRGKKGG